MAKLKAIPRKRIKRPNRRELRDEFALAVLPGAMRQFYTDGDQWDGHDDVAEHCYRVADAMMRAREA